MNRGGTRPIGLASAEDQCCICLGLAAEREDIVAAGGHGTCSPVAFALAINNNQQQSTPINTNQANQTNKRSNVALQGRTQGRIYA